MRIDFVTELQKLKDVSPSFLFLYPLLQLDKKIQPLGTYLKIKELDLDYSLICLFHHNQENFHPSWLKQMEEHTMFQAIFTDSDGFHYVLFDFLDYTPIVKQIQNGEYSTISSDFKLIMSQNKNTLTHIGLYPDQYYDQIAEDLEIDVEYLIQGRELISPPNPDKEFLTVPKSIREQMFKELIEV